MYRRVVPVQTVLDGTLLLEVLPEREVQERASVRDELHGRGEPALYDRRIAGGEMQVQVRHVSAHVDPIADRE
jgi:hypothetical protein